MNGIQVEDEIFCVPRCEFLVSSTVMSDMFQLPKGSDGVVVEGSDKVHPLVLEGYKKADFTALLKIMYPR